MSLTVNGRLTSTRPTMKNNPQASEFSFDAQQSYEINLGRPSNSTASLGVVIPYTTSELTKAALRHAGVCTDLNVHVSLVDIQIVPFPCPLDQPPIDKEFSEQRLRDLLMESRLAGSAEVLYTRDWLDGFRRVLEPKSLVILGTKRRWWRTREEKLARALSKAGHQVMLLHL
jgi:hypothetical protein